MQVELKTITKQPSPRLSGASSSHFTVSSSRSTQFHYSSSSTSRSTEAWTTQRTIDLEQRSTHDEHFFKEFFEDLGSLNANSTAQESERMKAKYKGSFETMFKRMTQYTDGEEASQLLERTHEMLKKAWSVPKYGRDIASSLCNNLRAEGALDILVKNCSTDKKLGFWSAKVLQQCMTQENREHIVNYGLNGVVSVACSYAKNSDTAHSRVGTGLLENLFRTNEITCSEMVELGGLDALINECKNKDVETLRHCAGALANLSLYGGKENQEAMVKRKVQLWLYHLAFQDDNLMKYLALIAIAVLGNNSEIEAAVEQSEALEMINRFVTSRDPIEFAKTVGTPSDKHWLVKLLPILTSVREEAKNIAAFHFCVEANLRKKEGDMGIFKEIGSIDILKQVAGCPNAIASKFAAQTLRLIGEQVPQKLSQQVPLWSCEDVSKWISQIGFQAYVSKFVVSRVDGDLLLQMTEANLREDIGISNGILLKRFMRELQHLKKKADYSSRDTGNLNGFLRKIKPEFAVYTYQMLQAGVRKCYLTSLTEEQLANECGIANSIHRKKILETIRVMDHKSKGSEESLVNRPLDVFVSYRRSNGSQLASLLKVHLQLKGFSVFLDVERLEAGKFDNNLIQSIKGAKNFLLVLTPDSLERCKTDDECKDWIHREVVAALQAQCNIVPITDNFTWPNPEELPEDMRAVCNFNGVMWIHDYQEACVQKIERFLNKSKCDESSPNHELISRPEELNLSPCPFSVFSPKEIPSPLSPITPFTTSVTSITMSAPVTPIASPTADVSIAEKLIHGSPRTDGSIIKRRSIMNKVRSMMKN